MPIYTYRREDGTTFDIRQKFSDEPLTIDPESGQQVVRVIQAMSVIFKGSGFYVNDSKGKSSTVDKPKADAKSDAVKSEGDGAKSEASKSDSTGESGSTSSAPAPSKTDSKTETAKADTPKTTAATPAAGR